MFKRIIKNTKVCFARNRSFKIKTGFMVFIFTQIVCLILDS